MATGSTKIKNSLHLEPQSADPASPVEGDYHSSDGSARAEGLWRYDGAAWVKLQEGATGSLTVVTKTLDYTVLVTDDVVLMNNTIAKTATLPTAVGNTGKVFYIKKINSAVAGRVTIDGAGSETIDGETTIVVGALDDQLTIVSDGANWEVLEYPAVAARAGDASGQSLVSGTALTMDTIIYDTHGMFHATSGLVTIPISGKYSISGHVQTAAIAATVGQFVALVVEINGTSDGPMLGRENAETTTSRRYSAGGSVMLDLTKGDTVELAPSENVGAITVEADTDRVYFMIARIK